MQLSTHKTFFGKDFGEPQPTRQFDLPDSFSSRNSPSFRMSFSREPGQFNNNEFDKTMIARTRAGDDSKGLCCRRKGHEDTRNWLKNRLPSASAGATAPAQNERAYNNPDAAYPKHYWDKFPTSDETFYLNLIAEDGTLVVIECVNVDLGDLSAIYSIGSGGGNRFIRYTCS